MIPANCVIPTTLKANEKPMLFKGLMEISHAWDGCVLQGNVA